MAEEAPQVKPRSSCLGKLVVLIALLGVVGLGAAVYFIATPQDLSDIKGRTAGLASASTPPNLATILEKSIEGVYPISISEEQLNRYVQATLEAKQDGPLSGMVDLKGVRIRLHEGFAEVIIERTIFGRPQTLSMYVKVEQFIDIQGKTKGNAILGGEQYFPDTPRLDRFIRGGRFGKLEVPQGFLVLVTPSFKKLAAVYREELRLGFEEMSRITFEKGKLILDPRADGGSLDPGSGVF